MAPGGLRGVEEPAQINVQRCAVPECRHRDDLVLLLGAPRFSRRPVGLVSHAEGTRQIRLCSAMSCAWATYGCTRFPNGN